ncbi:MAG: methyltransferase domain-containing protein [Bacteroidota bacterium]
MKYAPQYLASATAIIKQYDGSVPLAVFLKQHFKANTKFGSKDRRYISQLCYTYFRTGHAIVASSVEEKIKASLFLCETNPGEWDSLFSDEWLAQWERIIDEKWAFVGSMLPGSDPNKLFPWSDELSDGIDPILFANSHLIQPNLFLRIRPGNEKNVLQKLISHKIEYQQLATSCLALPNGTKIDQVLSIDKEVVVQDYSSQRVAAFFPTERNELPVSAWDCCAASGGKSLLAYDSITNIRLTVSDVRPSIVRNLKERFAQAGIKNYHSFIADLTNEIKIVNDQFKIIICDAPCSGSGTWGRTPEQLYFFSKDKIDEYAALQKKIVANIIPHLKPGGYLLYITCSVFKKENEEAVAFIQGNAKLRLVKTELLSGYDKKADSMFAALFQLEA